jgi:hypothetical protein
VSEMDEQRPPEPVPEEGVPIAGGEPVAAQGVAAEVEQAVAAFDAHERSRAAKAKPVYTPFSLRDVDRRIWIAMAVFVVFVGVSVGGAPWHATFWITLGFSALISAPIVVAAIFLWQRDRH